MNILFVCTGNTCRSPMAEVIASSIKKEWSFRSAGVFAASGNPASSQAKTVLREKGLIENHQSQPLTPQLIEWADYIFAMTAGHKDVIAAQFPQAIEKMFTLKEFAIDSKEDVYDPYGGPTAVYQKTFSELETLIQAMLEKLDKIE